MNCIFICFIDKSIKSIYNVSIINNVTVWMNVNLLYHFKTAY